MRSAVITIVAGRHNHLRAQRRSLVDSGSSTAPDLHVVVSLGDDRLAAVLDDGCELPTILVHVPRAGAELPLAAGRNAGAAAALGAGADLLVFLDVDCLLGSALLTRYADAASQPGEDGALLCGPVTYLPPGPAAGWTAAELVRQRAPHPARPDPADGSVLDADHTLFWSLSFAVTSATWKRIGGFDERYVGYGAEDTDFAQQARELGIRMLWVGGADAFHQHHPTQTPPVQHVDSILRNGAVFAGRWGWWPMSGWLAQFERRGLVRRVGETWQRSPAIHMLSIPAAHPYVSAIRPASVTAALPDRVSGWQPDPLFGLDALRRAADRIDLIHLHFAFDQLSSAELDDWLGELDRLRLPLVLTVHDLRNPHHRTPDRHDAHLAALVPAATEVVTLTHGAAAEIAARFGRAATVIGHPTLDEHVVPSVPYDPRTVVIALKSLRSNIVQPARLVAAAVDGASRVGGRVRVDIHPEVSMSPELAAVREQANAGELDLCVHERFSDTELAAYLTRAHVCMLPYRFGTHSGLLELARDTGTRVVAPSGGYYAQQWDEVVTYVNDEVHGFDAASLRDAVEHALRTPPPMPADRLDRLSERARIRVAHEMLYRRALHR